MSDIQTPVILLTGKNGQIGWELQRSLLPMGKVIACGREELDLANNEQIREVIRQTRPDIIVNAAAYTAVDKAEEEPEIAMQINGTAPGIMADEAKNIGALMVHYSTDYVFNGEKETPYVETDKPDPINVYGKTKLAGEQAIQSSGSDYLIFRTSWVYSARGNNFLLTMMRLMQEREELEVVADQIGAPTWARMVAEATTTALVQSLKRRKKDSFESGLYHLTASGETTWHGFANEILEIVKKTKLFDPITKRIDAIGSEEYPAPAARPKNSRMNCNKLKERFCIEMENWIFSLGNCMQLIEGAEA